MKLNFTRLQNLLGSLEKGFREVRFLKEKQIGQTSGQFQLFDNQLFTIGQTSAEFELPEIVQTSAQFMKHEKAQIARK